MKHAINTSLVANSGPAHRAAPVATSSDLQPELTRSGRVKSPNHRLTSDSTFAWVNTVCIENGQTVSPMEKWRALAAEYMAKLNQGTLRGAFHTNLNALRFFLQRYLWQHGWCDPDTFFKFPANQQLPPLIATSGSGAPFKMSPGGYVRASAVHSFLNWVLDAHYSTEEDGHRVHLPHHRVPLPTISYKQFPSLAESEKSVLPYKYMRELRELLAPGFDFGDWTWAQAITGAQSGEMSGDWFAVPEELIDRTDPDCVSRTREVTVLNYQLEKPDPTKRKKMPVGTRTVHEIWSPVRAVALLVKLELPLRTFQVRVLDSGETDRSRIELNPKGDQLFRQGSPLGTTPLFCWAPNPDREKLLKNLPVQRGCVADQQGVFLRRQDEASDYVGFFINTNKTSDIDKDWQHRGYRIPWQNNALHRWLVKLRNWQQKYNPISQPTLWTELTRKHLGATKSEANLQEAAPTCFLFREAAAQGKPHSRGNTGNEERKCISDGRVVNLWTLLLAALEDRLQAAKQNIRLLKIRRKCVADSTPFFPLHALRVSLITALADAGMEMDILAKIAGHARIVMTLYYRKLSPVAINAAMAKAQEQLVARADEQMVAILKNKPYDDLPAWIVGDPVGLQPAIPRALADRNAAGWQRQLGGWCLMGGNTTRSHSSDHKTCGGCFNGGPPINDAGAKSFKRYASVPSKACIEGKCRWFVTRPEYCLEVAARLQLTLANLTPAQQHFEKTQESVDTLTRAKFHAERAGQLFVDRPLYDRACCIFEKAAADLDGLLLGIQHALQLLTRLKDLAKAPPPVDGAEPQTQLVAQGNENDLRWAFEKTSSELLLLSGLCLNAEFYPELLLDSQAAIARRSNLLDLALQRNKLPMVFANLSPKEQLHIGNRLLRELATPFGALPLDNLKSAVHLLEAPDQTGQATALTEALQNTFGNLPNPISLHKLLNPPTYENSP